MSGPPPSARISARELFDQVRERLGLRWVAGQRGEQRVLESGEHLARRPSLAGYLNLIYPNKVQILGTEELGYLDNLDSRLRWETLARITSAGPLALVISKDQPCPADLRDAAEESGTALWVSSRRGHELLTYLQYHLARALANRETLHGVFMEVYSIGVLITGDAGAGNGADVQADIEAGAHHRSAVDLPPRRAAGGMGFLSTQFRAQPTGRLPVVLPFSSTTGKAWKFEAPATPFTAANSSSSRNAKKSR